MSHIIKKILKIFLYPVYQLYKFLRPTIVRKFQNHKKVADKLYFKNFGRYIDWDHPTELNEKIRWMQFNTDISIWAKLADKYLVREFIKEKGCEDILIPLLGMWKQVDEIDFDKLPDSFVIKTNHGSGHVFAVTDKSKCNWEQICKDLKKFIKTPFGIETVETHYFQIYPVIIAEKLLLNDLAISSTIADYKFYCFNGEPFCCGVFYDRGVDKNVTFYDMNWYRHDEWRNEKYKSVPKDIPQPNTFEQMKSTCKILASEFPFVRMDYYESEGKLYFGEFTFTPAALTGGSLSKLAMIVMGEKLKLS